MLFHYKYLEEKKCFVEEKKEKEKKRNGEIKLLL